MSRHEVNSWINLTYDDERLTHSDIDLNGEIYYRDV